MHSWTWLAWLFKTLPKTAVFKNHIFFIKNLSSFFSFCLKFVWINKFEFKLKNYEILPIFFPTEFQQCSKIYFAQWNYCYGMCTQQPLLVYGGCTVYLDFPPSIWFSPCFSPWKISFPPPSLYNEHRINSIQSTNLRHWFHTEGFKYHPRAKHPPGLGGVMYGV